MGTTKRKANAATSVGRTPLATRPNAGFTLAEMMMSLIILSAVGLGAYSIIIGVSRSQKKLENAINRGFNTFTYVPKNTPLQPLTLSFVNRLGWLRVVSPNADEIGREYTDRPNRDFIVSITSDDARLEEPVWTKCEGDKDIKVICEAFHNGEARIKLELSPRANAFAIVRVQAEWPGLPSTHPFKRSPEYMYTMHLARDCEFNFRRNDAPKFLHHGAIWFDYGEKTNQCTEEYHVYRCMNGKVSQTTQKRVCP